MGGGGSNLRQQMVALCHQASEGPYTDGVATGMACDYSSSFYGLHDLTRLRIYTIATRPFVQWKLGNFRPSSACFRPWPSPSA